MPPPACLTAVSGSSPIVLIAPHGGRRDPALRPWVTGRLRVNDLHTAALTAELAAALDAAALINAEQDRNEVDLNRITAAHDGAPGFLEQLATILAATIARHRRATVLVVHGWNVIQPAADLGLGCLPGADPFVVGPAAVSPAFAATAVRALVEACGARAIVATVGARYPARHKENLLQLFTPRYRDDPRPLVRAVAAMAAQVDAVQLELGIPLRWPGPWRRRLLAACAAARPALIAPITGEALPARAPPTRPSRAASPAHRFEFTSPVLCGLIGIDPGGGGRLLLFPPTGGLVLFTGEPTGAEEPGCVGALALRPSAAGGLAVRFRGPLLHFPDTTPFLDLELGLAGARLVEADVALEFVPDDPPDGAGAFGRVAGSVTLDGLRSAIAGHGFVDDGTPSSVWPRLRAAFRLGDDARLALTMALDGEVVHGFLHRGGRREAVARAEARFLRPDAPLDAVVLHVELVGGERIEIVARALHRLPVIRARGAAPVRLEFAACRLDAATGAGPGDGPGGLAGWCEVGGL